VAGGHHEGEGEEVKTVAIVPAAGAGVRMGAGVAKQFMDLEGRPLLAVTLGHFERCAAVESIVLVVPPDRVVYCRDEMVRKYGLNKVNHVVEGGKRRQDSVRLGLEATQGRYELVLIHDGARPFVGTELINRVIDAASQHRAVVPALPVKETVKEVEDDGRVAGTPERKRFWLVQTPQAFRYEDIFRAHCRALKEDWEELTDDALLMEKLGIPVTVVEGREENIKITTPYDLELARFIMSKQRSPL
jgi:2-C-methyl-D-erythritol 4-phosphate cytidylyltransferase